ncbi:MAG: hypothetical protein IJ165_04140 [Proteobacteria bacterium]|nr:hypothetical protein [Pseudomonadota bacterium]
MKRKIVLVLSCLAMAGSVACHREEKIEETPVAEIEVSEPPEYVVPEKQVVRYAEDGIYKIDDKRYYGAVVPVGANELSKSDSDVHFCVPGMSMADIEFFVDKYFPYQNRKKYAASDVLEVYSTIKEAYAGGDVVPTLDVNVIRPTAESAVAIRVFWNEKMQCYEWVYQDPDLRKENRVEFMESSDEQPPEPQPFVMPSDEEIARMREVIEPMAFEKQLAEMKRLAAESEVKFGKPAEKPDEMEPGIPLGEPQARPQDEVLPGGGLALQNMMGVGREKK